MCETMFKVNKGDNRETQLTLKTQISTGRNLASILQLEPNEEVGTYLPLMTSKKLIVSYKSSSFRRRVFRQKIIKHHSNICKKPPTTAIAQLLPENGRNPCGGCVHFLQRLRHIFRLIFSNLLSQFFLTAKFCHDNSVL